MAPSTLLPAEADRPPIFDLFDTLKDSFIGTQLGHDRWYMLAVAAIVGGNDPERCDQLYLYLATQPQFQTPDQRRGMVRRLREALFKVICLVGVCKPLEAIIAINQVERDEDKDTGSPPTREGWQCDEANLERGMGWMKKIYTGNLDSTLDLFKDHPDFSWVSRHITYGLYLSDRQVLDDLDTEIVVFCGIMIQNLRTETHWHIRGIQRLGVSKEDVQVLWDDVHKVAEFFGMRLNRVPTVESVQYDV
ncbi:uncharacterized protein B0I36DRAFT_324796 [Microdochium trichocladiopsis]|uniref:Carboxymuconolactone decarboxylase-like domain-containing protein n=1 Tax=Microdochium trichocladiopsis TaxID=1682393 RepID=A0A9P8Y420_9PEZI|nr:uncharacterized protein B0I36DRAFT_324796 [Microdochium trichocladiopsis]KAH7028970.1 hypothetical protein B0I36DRAFT_324796 [Microdochium trichocladiopsis]